MSLPRLFICANKTRNRTVGIELGKGRHLPEILADLNGKVAEGVRSTTAALGLAARYGVEMPITEQMGAILHQDRAPKRAFAGWDMRLASNSGSANDCPALHLPSSVINSIWDEPESTPDLDILPSIARRSGSKPPFETLPWSDAHQMPTRRHLH